MRHHLLSSPRCAAGLLFTWLTAACRRLRLAVGVIAVGALTASCAGDQTAACQGIVCALEDAAYYASTLIVVAPGQARIGRGESTRSFVTIIYLRSPKYDLENVSFVPPSAPGLSIEFYRYESFRGPFDACLASDFRSGQVPDDVAFYSCLDYVLVVDSDATASGDYDIVLSAQFRAHNSTGLGPPIERLGLFRVSVGAPAPPTPDFAVAVAPVPGGAYGTRASVPIAINRVGGFAEDVTLAFDGLSSGLVGSFAIDPMPTDRRTLELQIPARYAGGGQVDLRITATATGGRQKVLNFSLFIEPLFRLGLSPASGTLTAASPLRIEVSLAPGQALRSPSIGAVELSISPATPLPDGVTAIFLDDAVPVVPEAPVPAVTRTLLLVSDGVGPGVMGPLQVRGTATGVPRDRAGALPFIETTLALTTVQGQSWQFVAGNLVYGVTDAEAIGLALQGNDRPAVTWLQGRADRVAYLRRFDGTTFAPSPSGGEASPLRAPSGSIDEAKFALSGGDIARIAFTYGGGAAMALGSSGATWTVGAPLVVGDPANAATPRARSPRIATGPAEAVVVSYIREADAASSGGELQVVQSSNGGAFSPMPGPQAGGALNAAATGKAVRNASALAVRADGRPWVAWVEQPADPAMPARLWLRAHDGAAWGAAIEAPTPGTPVGPSLQLLVEPSGMVVVAWLEGTPARVKLMRYDPASQTWSALNDTRNGRGSLNITAFLPALDVHLSRQSDGRLLVAWTEGGADPRVWIKRQEADGSWVLVGTTVSPQFVWSKTPFVAGDRNNQLHVAWAQHLDGRGPETATPEAEVYVAQWIGQ